MMENGRLELGQRLNIQLSTADILEGLCYKLNLHCSCEDPTPHASNHMCSEPDTSNANSVNVQNRTHPPPILLAWSVIAWFACIGVPIRTHTECSPLAKSLAAIMLQSNTD